MIKRLKFSLVFLVLNCSEESGMVGGVKSGMVGGESGMVGVESVNIYVCCTYQAQVLYII